MALNERTSPTVASRAAKLLSDPLSSPDVKSVAASALTQTPDRNAAWLDEAVLAAMRQPPQNAMLTLLPPEQPNAMVKGLLSVDTAPDYFKWMIDFPKR